MKECDNPKSAILRKYSLIVEEIIMGGFEDLIIRKQAEKLTVEIYTILKDLKDYGFKDQIQRASVSVMNNIAEGFERGTLKDKQKFLIIAKGSVGEVRSMLHVAHKLTYISTEMYDSLHNICLGISSGIQSLCANMKF